MKMIDPEDGGRSSTRDEAAKTGYSLHKLERLISDIARQPDWRSRADKAHAYYDMGKQISSEKRHKIQREWGLDPGQTNLVHGVINGVLGQEAKARTDVKIEADDEDLADVSEVMNKALKEAQREGNIDMAVSNGYAGQVKGGLGWVEVSRALDPLDYPYRVTSVHRNEVWYDWRATDLNLKTARWMVRARWQDLDEAEAMMPEFKEILRQAVNGWSTLNTSFDENSNLYQAYTDQRTTSIRNDEWCDGARKRIKFYEVWYRVSAEVVVMQLSPTRRIVYDDKNPLHVEAVSRNKVKLTKSITQQIRMALFAGPHRLMDEATTRRSFPYIPFFAFQDDEDRSPYGLIEGMIGPQDEYNDRRQMINWMLKARQIRIDNDALDLKMNSIQEIARTAMRPDMIAIMNPNRRNAQGFTLGNDMSLQREQVDVMNDAKQLIQEVPRIYSTQLGSAPAGVTSGVAINSLTEAGAIAMGELNDNYRTARKAVFEQVLDLILEDHLEEQMQVKVGSGASRRVIVLNSWVPETNMPLNRVKDAAIKVGLSDVPNSPAYRMQEQQQMATMIQALASNPQALAILAPAYLEGSSLSNRTQLAGDLRKLSGLPATGDKNAEAAQQQQAAAAQQQGAQLQERMAMADLGKKEAETQRAVALTHREQAQTQLLSMKMNQPAPAANDDDMINEALQEAAAN